MNEYWPSKIGAPRGMTYSQYEDLNRDWLTYGDGEPLGLGLSKIWWLPLWTEERGSDFFAIPGMIHDIHGTRDQWGEEILSYRIADSFFSEGMQRIIDFHPNEKGLSFKRKVFNKLVWARRFSRWPIIKTTGI